MGEDVDNRRRVRGEAEFASAQEIRVRQAIPLNFDCPIRRSYDYFSPSNPPSNQAETPNQCFLNLAAQWNII